MLEIFDYEFMQRAFIVGISLSILTAVLGSFIVLKRYAMLPDALSHIALLGVGIGLVTHSSPIYVPIVVAVIAAISIEYLRYKKRLYSDAILSIFLSGALAMAIILINISDGFNASLFSYLFGSITAVSDQEVNITVGFTLISLLLLLGSYRKLLFATLDEASAQASGIPVFWLNLMLVVLSAVTVALAMRIVGILLIGALMVLPISTALLYKENFIKTIGMAILFSLTSVISGLVCSYHMGLSSGASIVLIALGFFIISLFLNL
ncbi:MAG: metal ABC transporter permease [Epsilonproteobacteria bacterium]|nr:MAG: metal ABC transporter permease [Campylobacterota bacterium]